MRVLLAALTELPDREDLVLEVRVQQIDKTYGHLLPDAIERTRSALDAFLSDQEEAKSGTRRGTV